MIAAVLLAAATAVMELHSGDFTNGGAIPLALMSTDCGGKNRTPSLIWMNAPKGTRSFALVEHDPDAAALISGGFDHWVLYNLPAQTHELAGNASISAQRVGLSSTGKAAYYGPCPPSGPAHHYVFTLYALDVAQISADAPLSASQLRQRIGGHILARATLEATAARP